MNHYELNRVPGQTFFCTVRLAEKGSSLLTEHLSALGEAVRQTRGRRPFHVDAWVVLPSHSHAIWTLPQGDEDCASRWRAVKIAFSKAVRKTRGARSAIWVRRFHQESISDAAHYQQLVDFVHASPVAEGLCTRPADWPWSSVHRFLAEGFIPPVQQSDVLPLAPLNLSHECRP